MESDVHVAVNRARQSGFYGPIRGGSSGNGLGIEHALADDPELTRARGHQHAAIGKKRRAEGRLDITGDRDDTDSLAFPCVEFHGQLRQRTVGETLRGYRDAVREGNLLLAGGKWRR